MMSYGFIELVNHFKRLGDEVYAAPLVLFLLPMFLLVLTQPAIARVGIGPFNISMVWASEMVGVMVAMGLVTYFYMTSAEGEAKRKNRIA